jgi:hypothetical protein
MNTFLKRFFDLAIDDFTRLKRFRRVAMNHDVALPETGMLEKMEIERLREQLNASVFLEAEPWMLPSWLDLTMKNLNKDELHITHLPNNSYRNWSLIGGVGSRRYLGSRNRRYYFSSPYGKRWSTVETSFSRRSTL